MQPETKFKVRALGELREIKGTWWVKVQQVSISGTPDIIGCVGTRFVAIELKRNESEVPNPLQEWNLQKIANCGAIALSASPESWPEVYGFLRTLARTLKLC